MVFVNLPEELFALDLASNPLGSIRLVAVQDAVSIRKIISLSEYIVQITEEKV